MMKKMKFGILMVVAVLLLVSAVSAAIPAGGAAVTAKGTYPFAGSYWGIEVITSAVPSDLPVASGYAGWCVDANNGMSKNVPIDFTAYSSLNTVPAFIPSADWNKINYILNHKHADWKITQAAMWHYDGMSLDPYPTHDNVVGYSEAAYDLYIAQVEAHGADYVPKCGKLYAIILYKRGVQAVIVEGHTIPCDNTPEFPTLALPVAMLIGVIGTVEYIRTRKE
jgi:hypothetical protein